MARTILILIVTVFAACGPDGNPLVIHYSFTGGDEQSCSDITEDQVVDCNDIPMTCDSVALLRIIDPDTGKVYIDDCARIPNQSPQHKLCPINQPFSSLGAFPTSRVEIQLAVYPLKQGDGPGIVEDLDGTLHCPPQIDFTATGFAAPTNDPEPALAGRVYSDGFDSEVTIELGCNDIASIDTDVCRNEDAQDVTASVLDFDEQVSVSPDDADNLSVRVGEPRPLGQNWVFDVASTAELPLLPPDMNPNPEWGADNLNVSLTDYACIQVLELVGRAVASLNCRPLTAPVPRALDLTGFRVNATTLNQVLDALGFLDLPDAGLVIGIVFGPNGTPQAGAVVSDDGGSTIQYLSSDGMSLGGTSTSDTGIFVSGISGSPDDAPFEVGGIANHWRATAPTLVQSNDPVGGRVNFRLSVVVIHMDNGF